MSKAEPIGAHDDAALFRDAVRFTADGSGFAPRLIEKDYFCTLLLDYLFTAAGAELVFKGGTCLTPKRNIGCNRRSQPTQKQCRKRTGNERGCIRLMGMLKHLNCRVLSVSSIGNQPEMNQAIQVKQLPDKSDFLLSINLEWPTQITETEFFKRVKEMPKAKVHGFLSSWDRCGFPIKST